MGNLLSTTSKPSPNSNATTTMSSSQIPETSQEPKPQTDPTHQPKTLETQKPPQECSDPPMKNDPETLGNQEDEKDVEGEEEEEGECGFCLFMKGGGCKDSFIDWEKCVEEGEKNKEDIVEKCFEVTAALKKCMEAHPDYYEPIFKAEKAAEEEAVRELEKEKEAGGSASESSGSEKSGSS
ncbi:unnamed protein product [Ilex paraguariensis]|uniref:GCK domain-containing protein n=1 Tax=Ilex paraguariensis TaxID=185542 RepID=A0ABC8QTQ8_9AQUA